MNLPIRILVADDHEIVREGLCTLFSEETDLLVVGEAKNGEEAVRLALALSPDVVLMDLMMPGLDGIEATRRILAQAPAARILVLTSFAEEPHVRRAIAAGAHGFLLKDVLKEELLRAIRDVAEGRPALHPEAQRHLMRRVASGGRPVAEELTERELSVLQLIGRGRANKDIAKALHLSEGTVKGHVSAVLAKLGVEDRTQAALFAVREGLVPLRDD
jgi:DNA-binding NarL/FixJ family response regulator